MMLCPNGEYYNQPGWLRLTLLTGLAAVNPDKSTGNGSVHREWLACKRFLSLIATTNETILYYLISYYFSTV